MDTKATLQINKLLREIKGTSEEFIESVTQEPRGKKLEQINERRDAIVRQLFAHLKKEGGMEKPETGS